MHRTGASGYLGGQILHDLHASSSSPPKHSIVVLVRSSDSARKISSAYANVRIVIGSLDDVEIVEAEASKADIVLSGFLVPRLFVARC